jgi:hypothetical protein
MRREDLGEGNRIDRSIRGVLSPLDTFLDPLPVPSTRDKRERNDDPRQKRRGHWYSVNPSNHTISIDYPDRRSVNYLDHSQPDASQ